MEDLKWRWKAMLGLSMSSCKIRMNDNQDALRIDACAIGHSFLAGASYNRKTVQTILKHKRIRFLTLKVP